MLSVRFSGNFLKSSSTGFFRLISSCILALSLTSCGFCGFHLRGNFDIPEAFRTLIICPDDPFEPFQRVLRQTFKRHCITVVETPPCGMKPKFSTLVLSPIIFEDRNVGYGTDVQVNRATIVLTFAYEIDDPCGKVLLPKTTIQVERDLTVNTNAILGTENERNKIKAELYNDAVSQLMRQLSNFSCEP